jgi:hypothetical protein
VRIHELQERFDSPDDYARSLDWTLYTVYDAADVLRRYLVQLPEPVVPVSFYPAFLEPILQYQQEASKGTAFRDKGTAAAYRKLAGELPTENQHLFVYLLDLLAFFASNSEDTRLRSDSLATIFQPELLSPVLGQMSLSAYMPCQAVLEYLINMGDSFAVDEITG